MHQRLARCGPRLNFNRPGNDIFVGMRIGSAYGSVQLAVATVATAIGACAIGASVMSPVAFGTAGDWLVAGGGVITLLGGMTYLAISFAHRDGHVQ